MSLSQRLSEQIVAEIHRIRWEVRQINQYAFILRDFAEEVLLADVANSGEEELETKGHPTSCVSLGSAERLDHEDLNFLCKTESLVPLFAALQRRCSSVLFIHVVNTRGITRGFPWKDVSVLPAGFKPTEHSFFYIADEEHNPEKLPRWTEPYLCPLTKIWMVTCAIPLYLEGDRFFGIIGIDINLEQISKPLGNVLRSASKGYAFFLSPSGNLVVSSDQGVESLHEDQILVRKEWRRHQETAHFRGDDVKVRKVVLSSGRARLLQAYIDCNGWNLFCILPEGRGNRRKKVDIDALPGDGTLPAVGNTEQVYLPMMSFISSFSESLRQIENLIEGTRIIGSGALDHRIAVERKDEIGLLAVSINKMAAELEKGKEEFESVYRKISQMDRLSALGQLTAGIAHEINNPLAIISNYIQILLMNPNLHPEVKSDMQAIDEEVTRTTEIIRRLLSFSGQATMKKGVVQINDVLDNTLQFLRFQLKSQGIELVERYDDALPLTVGSSTELQQAFVNILLNASQAMPNGGKLEVGTKLKGRADRKVAKVIEVHVSDTGQGIERKFLDKVFDPFFTLKPLGRGTGLGLSISYGIVKEHAGSIDMKSKPGKGTTVKIRLPVARKER